jgi:hypothetical protein
MSDSIDGKPMSPHARGYYNELLSVMYRWSRESDITMGEWLRATHLATEKVLLIAESELKRKRNNKE